MDDSIKIDELYNILLSDKPSVYIKDRENKIFDLIPELKVCKGFEQNSKWHIYDVYEHILHVVDNVGADIILRLAALFHDIGKPISYTEDSDGVGHFYGHYEVSKKIFDEFAKNNNIDISISKKVSDLIYYHDINISKLSSDELDSLYNVFDMDGINRLFELKRADLLAQNKKYYYIFDEYDKQEKELLKHYK